MANRTLIYTSYDAKSLRDSAEYKLVLKDDGSADLSALPDELRTQWEAYGLSSRGLGHALPSDGQAFFNILLMRANPYFRIREAQA